jgi:hypothetical protein
MDHLGLGFVWESMGMEWGTLEWKLVHFHLKAILGSHKSPDL